VSLATIFKIRNSSRPFLIEANFSSVDMCQLRRVAQPPAGVFWAALQKLPFYNKVAECRKGVKGLS
jgi:hypothetical protein